MEGKQRGRAGRKERDWKAGERKKGTSRAERERREKREFSGETEPERRQQPVPYDGDPSVFCSQEGGMSAGTERERERALLQCV